MRVYLDNAATTAVDQRVIDAMLPYYLESFGNPSSIHAFGRQTRAALEKARKCIADHLNASMGEIFFTSGGTESNNMALKCAVRDLKITRVISSPIEHHCVENSLACLQQTGQISLDMVPLAENGHLDYDQLEKMLSTSAEDRTLVSLMHANNEIGNLLDLPRVARMCKKFGAWLHSDTVQTVGHYDINLQETPIHFISGSAHKFHGPKGAGFIYINSNTQVQPLIHGGSQERNMRAGTENVAGIIGLAKAFDLACQEMSENRAKIEGLKFRMAERLQDAVPGVAFNGDWQNGLYTVLNVRFPKLEAQDMLLFNLDISGIAASGGSACSSGSDVGSHVIQALGVDPQSTSIRFSFSHMNTTEEVDFAVDALKEIYQARVRA
jgi:cysteine desulfurase